MTGMGGFDLHTHSTFSDGTTSIEDNIRLALDVGLEGLGITDHDTTASFEPATAAAADTGLQLVLGTEFSAELDGMSVHVLGYWIDPTYQPLASELARLADERTDRARRIVRRFIQLGIDVSFERVVELAAGAPIGRPHIAQAVVETGAVATTREVFDRFLADGGPAYVEKHAVTPPQAVQLLTAAGGVAVLAHPGLTGNRAMTNDDAGIAPEVIEELVAVGLAGVEADHPDHTPGQQRRFRDLARALRIEVTGGSDYHGEGKTNQLGERTTPRQVVERLAARRG